MNQDAIATLAPESPNIFNGLTGLISKTADTALETYRLRQEAKYAPSVGSVSPSGQVNPDRLVEQPSVPSVSSNAQTALAFAPYLIYGGILIVGGFAVFALLKGRK